MNTGRPWKAFAEEVVRQRQTKKDYVVTTPTLQMLVDSGAVATHNLAQAIRNTEIKPSPADFHLKIGSLPPMRVRDLAHSQLAEFVGIPKPYYDRMRKDAPMLLVENIQTWLNKEEFLKTRMIRTLDGHVRAFLSNGYRPLDNLDLLMAVKPTLDAVGAEILSCEVTDTRLYIKAVSHKIRTQPKVGDIVEAGVLIQNSEVGMGRLKVAPFLHTLACTNGAVSDKYAFMQTHVGKRTRRGGDDLEMPEEWLSDETRRADDAAFFGKVRDMVAAYFNPDELPKIAAHLKDAAGRPIGGEVVNVVKEVTDRFALSEDESKAVLANLIEGHDNTQYGLGNAITLLAGKVTDYDRSTELETLGGKVFELGDTDWEGLLKTAGKAA